MSTKVNLIEYIHPKMDVLFVALNAPEVSNRNAHWFSRNLSFWNLLYNSGLITAPISDPKEGDVLVFGSNKINHAQMIYGVTDLNRDLVMTDSRHVITDRSQVERILSVLDKTHTARICLMHSKVASEFEIHGLIKRNFNAGKNQYGKVGNYKNTEIFEVPFHNASIGGKERYYQQVLNTDSMVKAEIKTNIVKPEITKPAKDMKTYGSFILPAPGNSITEADIEKGTLRITVDAKHWFPQQNATLVLNINGEQISAKYTRREGRSDLLKVGRSACMRMGLKPSSRLRFHKIKADEFLIELI